MTLIEGIGDEVTILVTIIVAVTTIIAAWYSTSVQDEHSHWDESIHGSVIDPDPLGQESSSSGDGDEEIDVSESNDNLFNTIVDQTDSTATSTNADVPNSTETNVENIGGACSCIAEEILESCDVEKSVLKVENENQCSGFESVNIPGISKEPENITSTTLCSELLHDVESASANRTAENNVLLDSVKEDEKKDLNDQQQPQEKTAGKRNVQSTESTFNSSAERTPDSPSSKEGLGQSEVISQTSPNLNSQSDEASRTGQARRSSQTSPPTRDQTASGVISIKLRFLDESERVVSTNMDDTLGNFRRETFTSEIQSGMVVRFISNGQLLTDDSRTLASYGICNNHVIHCQISRATSPTASQQHRNRHSTDGDTGDADFDLGRYMVPIFACVLAFVWYLRFQYRYMFNATSTLSLTAVTVVFVLALFAAWRS